MGKGPTLTPTRRARLLLTIAAALYLGAYIAVTVTPAVLATALLLYLLHARRAARTDFEDAKIRMERSISESVLRESEPTEVRLRVEATFNAGVLATVTESIPDDLEAEPETFDIPGEIVYDAIPRRPGTLSFPPIQMSMTGRRRLWTSTQAVGHATMVTVLPRHESARDADRDNRMEPRVTAIGQEAQEREFESMRPFVPGDRIRDIDWKRLTFGREIHAKQWERFAQGDLVILLDAGRSMRRDGRLDHAARLVHQLVASAAESQVPYRLIAFDEIGILHQTGVQSGTGSLGRIRNIIASLPPPARGMVESQSQADPAPSDQGFLESVARLRGRSAAMPGLSAALHLHRDQSSGTSFVLFSDLAGVPGPALNALTRLQGRQHVAVVLLPWESYHRPTTVRGTEAMYVAHQHRRQATAWLRGRGIQVVDIGPEDSARRIRYGGAA